MQGKRKEGEGSADRPVTTNGSHRKGKFGKVNKNDTKDLAIAITASQGLTIQMKRRMKAVMCVFPI